MSEVRTIGLDLAKNIFQVHGADASGAVVFRKQLRRGQVLKFFGSLPGIAKLFVIGCKAARPLLFQAAISAV